MSRDTGVRRATPPSHAHQDGGWLQNVRNNGIPIPDYLDPRAHRLQQAHAHSRAEQIAAAQREREELRNQAVLSRLPQL